MTQETAEARPGRRAENGQLPRAAAQGKRLSPLTATRFTPSTTPVVLVFAVVAVTILVGAFTAYHGTRQGLRKEELAELLTVADLKTEQITRWRRERLAEGLSIGHASYFGRAFAGWAARGAPDDAERARLVARVRSIRDGYGYRKVWLTDVSGTVRLTVGEEEPLSGTVRAAIEEARRDRKPHLTDLHQKAGEIEMDLVVPLIDVEEGHEILGFYVCEWDPGTYLFPLIQRWPGTSGTAETLLVRREGEQLLFLNELRHRKGTALALRVPARADLPATHAPLERAAGEGIDYRGVPVLAAWRPIPGTSWGIVAKVDRAEVFAPVRFWGGVMAGTLTLLLAVSSVAVGLWVRQQRLWLELRERTAELERTAHERALQVSEARLRQFAESTDDVIWINGVEPERKIYLSPSVERVWGVPADRFLAEPRGWMESVAPEQRQRVCEAYDAVVAGRAARYEAEYRIHRPDGETRWILDSGKPVPDATGRIRSVVGIAKDITTRKLAEEKAARMSRLYEALSATNRAVVHAATPGELFQQVCDAAVLGGDFPVAWIAEVEPPGDRIRFAAVAGRSREMAGEVRLALDPADLHSTGPAVEALRTGETVVENDLGRRFESSPGPSSLSEIPRRYGVASAAAVPLRRDRRVVGCLTVFSAEKDTFDGQLITLLEEMGRDVSFALDSFDREQGRRTAEAALRESEERWRTIVQNEPECVKVLDREGRLLEMNPAGLSMIQATLEQVLGKRAASLVAEEDRAAFDEMVAAVFRGETRHLVFDMIGLEGRRLTLETTSSPLWNTTGASPVVSAALGVTRDVTERRRAEEAIRDSERDLREAQALGRMGSYVYDFQADRWSSSEVLDDIFGIDASYVRSLEGWLGLVAPTERDEMGAYLKRLTTDHERFDKDYRIVRRSDGETRWVHGRGILEYADDGTPRRLRGTIQDITERKRDEERLRRAATVFSSSREGFVITNDKGDIEEINEAFTAITLYTRAEAIGRNMRILRSGRHGPAFYEAMWTELLRSGQWQGEIWNRRKDDTVYPEWLSISAVRDERASVAGYVGVFSDISTLKAAEERLEHLARHDPLTDLPNRLLLKSYLDLALSRGRRSGRAVAVLFLDLDRFKNVNDSLGHAAGDELLRSAAQVLRERLRQGDLIARLGGDEFVVLLEDVDGSQAAAAVASNLIDRFRQPFVLGGGRDVYVGLSIGISMFPGDGDRAEVLIQNADAALYSAKEHGRNTFRFYSEALTVAANERLALEADLRRGLALGQFLLHYQPVVRLADGRTEGVEALLRWQSPDRGLVMPSSFIGAAEETGLIVPLGDHVLHGSCRQMKAWLEAGLPIGRMSVNVSPRQLLQPDLEQRVETILAETGLDASRLELEITESAIMEQGAEAEARLAALRRLGVRIAIDDFGTGYSSLSHLRRFPIDTFKIDRSFIAGLPEDRTQRGIVLTIISLARQLGLHVVAEGVETRQQVDFLGENACSSAQGFYFSAPLPADRIADFTGRG